MYVCDVSTILLFKMQEESDQVARKWMGTELQGNLLKYSSLAARPADKNKEAYSVEIQQDLAQWPPVSETQGEGDGKDFILLFLAGARHWPGPWKITERFLNGTSRAKQTLLYMEPICKVVWLFCNHCAHGWNLSHRCVSGAATSWSTERALCNLGLSGSFSVSSRI